MNTLRLNFAVLTLVLSASVFAQATFGNFDCAQWVNDQGKDRTQNRAWFIGYLSGLNVGFNANSGKDQIRKLSSPDQAMLWMDNYCRTNPLNKIRSGAEALYIELERR